MRNPEEIIFEINNISELKKYNSNHKIELANRRSFNKHLRLCKPTHKRLLFRGASEKEWKSWLDEGTEYYLLFVDDKPVARCAIERYSDSAWEAADVKTVLNYRNKGLSKEIVSFVTQKILEQGKTATCSTMPDNYAMLKVINSLGYIRR